MSPAPDPTAECSGSQPDGASQTEESTGSPRLGSDTRRPERSDPLELLRAAIDGLNSSDGEFIQQSQFASLLAEAERALEHAAVVAQALTGSEEAVSRGQFENAFQALDTALVLYPTDPALLKRRSHVEEQRKAFERAAEVQKTLAEAQWLLDQNRPDLAAQFLREKVPHLADEPAVNARLNELDALVLQWEHDRHVQTALAQAAVFEQQQQWEAGLTILEGTIESYPDSVELAAAAQRVRARLLDRERQKTLARRVESIQKKIAGHAWKPALRLLDTTQREFPDAVELVDLRQQLEAARRRFDCEAILTEVRRLLADGEIDRAEQILRERLKSYGPELSLELLQPELESERKYREDLRAAQVLLGRHQLEEAERVLERHVAASRPDAKALSAAIRQARAAAKEEDFFDHSREKALELIEQQQFDAAAKLLCNLLALFPGNPILEKDLLAAQNRKLRSSSESGAAPPATPAREEHVTTWPDTSSPDPPVFSVSTDSADRDGSPLGVGSVQLRRIGIPIAACVALVLAGAAAWQLSHRPSPPVRPNPPVTKQMPPVRPVQFQDGALPFPPGTVTLVSSQTRDPGAATAGNTNGIQDAQLIEQTQPRDPGVARPRGSSGAVRLQASVDETGAVKDVKLLNGDPVLAASAEEAIRKWKYKPATQNGRPLASVVVIQLLFGQNESPAPAAPNR
jgi:TonB family protein